jgi:hypothetical protein
MGGSESTHTREIVHAPDPAALQKIVDLERKIAEGNASAAALLLAETSKPDPMTLKQIKDWQAQLAKGNTDALAQRELFKRLLEKSNADFLAQTKAHEVKYAAQTEALNKQLAELTEAAKLFNINDFDDLARVRKGSPVPLHAELTFGIAGRERKV